MAALVSRALRWVQLIEPLGYRPRVMSTFHAIMFGYLANMAIPRLGEISRCGALSKSDEVPFEQLLGTVIVERLFDVLMLLVCIGITALLEFDRLGGFLYAHVAGPIIAKAGNVYLLGAVLLCGLIAGLLVVRALFRMSNPPALVQRIRGLMTGMLHGLKSVTRVKRKNLFIFHTLFIWTMYFMMSYVCLFALPETASLGAAAGIFIMVLGGIGMTAPVQGGIGAYHLLVSKGLLLYGLSETDGLVYATLTHTASTLLLIILGIISMLILFFVTKPKNSAIPL